MKRKRNDETIAVMARRLLQAIPRTPPRVTTNMPEGEQSARSSRYARRLARQEQSDTQNDSINNNQRGVSVNDDDNDNNDNGDDDDDNEESDDSNEPPNNPSSAAETVSPTDTKECVICLDEFNVAELIQAPCGHGICQTCIIRFVEQSMANEDLFPPKCCQQPIPITANDFLPQYLVNLFEQKSIEYGTLDRTYCNNRYCSSFIPPSSIEDDVATCKSCGHRICVICKNLAHVGPCGDDAETRDLLALAANEGWKRCTQCGRVIEREMGCNVMANH
ncbi:hypothetical protein ACHAQD_008690 [Fusarium lateritium]